MPIAKLITGTETWNQNRFEIGRSLEPRLHFTGLGRTILWLKGTRIPKWAIDMLCPFTGKWAGDARLHEYSWEEGRKRLWK